VRGDGNIGEGLRGSGVLVPSDCGPRKHLELAVIWAEERTGENAAVERDEDPSVTVVILEFELIIYAFFHNLYSSQREWQFDMSVGDCPSVLQHSCESPKLNI
jgi:hypothetical protein